MSLGQLPRGHAAPRGGSLHGIGRDEHASPVRKRRADNDVDSRTGSGDVVSLIETGLDQIYSPVALDWSPDSEKVALVSTLGVHVFDRTGALLWQYETKDLRGNPRWSPDGNHLYVYATTQLSGGERPDAYLFRADGELGARLRAGGACAGDPWLADASGFRIARYWMNDGPRVWSVDSGTLIEEHDPAPSPDLVVYGVQVDSDIGHNYVHLSLTTVDGDLETILFTTDGRFMFTTPSGGGRGGCATGVVADIPPLAIERAPFEAARN